MFSEKSMMKYGALIVFFATVLVVQLIVLIPMVAISLQELYTNVSASLAIATVLSHALLFVILLISIGYSCDGFKNSNVCKK